MVEHPAIAAEWAKIETAAAGRLDRDQIARVVGAMLGLPLSVVEAARNNSPKAP